MIHNHYKPDDEDKPIGIKLGFGWKAWLFIIGVCILSGLKLRGY